MAAIRATGRHTAVLAGYETDVCVTHSAVGLSEAGYRRASFMPSWEATKPSLA
jgi:nicotinamidase-related amidase